MLNGKELILAIRPYAKEIRSKSWQETGRLSEYVGDPDNVDILEYEKKK
jgi:hypothetical protein